MQHTMTHSPRTSWQTAVLRYLRASVCLALLVSASAASKDDRPNVLFVAVDDMNDLLGYRGHPDAITPNLDRLAAEGTHFSRAYCQYPVCGPSRASLMSGFYYHQLHSQKLQIKDDDLQEQVHKMGSLLLHEQLAAHGYKTMAVGKINHTHIPKGSVDLSGGRGGWDQAVDAAGNKIELNWKSDKTLTDWGVYPGDEAEMSDSQAATWAVERLGEQHEEPFMLMVGFLRPHVPWIVPQRYFDLYDRDKLTLPPYLPDDLDDVPEAARELLNKGYPRTEWAIEQDTWRDIMHAYLASVSFADAKLGEVLAALDASPYRDNTLIVLWSDHGYHLGEKNTFQKHTLWDRSAVAPLIIRGPKAWRDQHAAAHCDRVVGMIDLYPTILELCGLPPNEHVMGRSLVPLLKNAEAEWDYPAFTFRNENAKSLQYGDLRFIEYDDGSMELYDHASDPHEHHNLATLAEYQETLQTLRAMFDSYGVLKDVPGGKR